MRGTWKKDKEIIRLPVGKDAKVTVNNREEAELLNSFFTSPFNQKGKKSSPTYPMGGRRQTPVKLANML